jgi:hypothetical protein
MKPVEGPLFECSEWWIKSCGIFKMALQRARGQRRGEACSFLYVKPLSDTRTQLADFSNILSGRSKG